MVTRGLDHEGAGGREPGAAVQRSAAYVLGADAASDDRLATDLLAWLSRSPRFRTFVESSRDKIRKKVRGARSDAARLDLHAELHVAALLLRDPRIALAYEAYGAGRRGPDFTVVHRAGRPFNIEVTRRRAASPEAMVAPPILGKLRQLPPSSANVLVVAVEGAVAVPDPGPVLQSLRSRAERGDDRPFASLGAEGAATFLGSLRRLTSVLTWTGAASSSDQVGVAVWTNPNARIELPRRTLEAVVAALEGDPD